MTRALGLGSHNWLGDPQLALISVIAIHTWQWTPFAFLVLLATLSTLPPDVYEAARLDRAGAWQRFVHLTLPLIRPAIVMVVILRMMTALSAFAAIFAATGGGPGSATEILNLYAYRTSFTELNLGYGASLAMVLLAITLLISYFMFRLRRARCDEALLVLRRSSGEGACGQAGGARLRRSAPGRRLPCDARPRGLPHNSLRSLRSLRSNSCGKSDDEARCARGHEACASRRRRRAPPACPHAPSLNRGGLARDHERWVSRQAVPGGGDVCSDEQRRAGVGARAVRASSSDSPQLSERSERSERSEFCGATWAEQRSAVGAQRRPRASEPPPGTACRDARSARRRRRDATP